MTVVVAQAHTQESIIPPVAGTQQQQQQAEQMRMYWKVCARFISCRQPQIVLLPSSSRECLPTLEAFHWIEFSLCSVSLLGTIRLLISFILSWKLRGGKEWLCAEMVFGNWINSLYWYMVVQDRIIVLIYRWKALIRSVSQLMRYLVVLALSWTAMTLWGTVNAACCIDEFKNSHS